MRIVDRRTVQPEDYKKDAQRQRGPQVDQTLDFKVTPHLLRHTYITRLCASGCDIKKIQYLAGHSEISMTLGIYSHVVGNTPDELIGSIEDAFSGQSSGQNGATESRKVLNIKG